MVRGSSGDGLESKGWPVDRDASMTWDEVIAAAERSTPVKTGWFRPKGSS